MKGQICLRREDITLASWVYVLLPFLAVLDVVISWLVYGIKNVPAGLMWCSVFVTERLCDFGVRGINYLYGYRRLEDLKANHKLAFGLEVLAICCAVLYLAIADIASNWYWRIQIIGFFVIEMIMMAWVLQRLFRDLQNWDRLRDERGEEIEFREYVEMMERSNKDSEGDSTSKKAEKTFDEACSEIVDLAMGEIDREG